MGKMGEQNCVKEKIVTYSSDFDREDIILYHVLHDVSDIFYIDVGSNHPVDDSVTKFFYDRGACGINIEPQKELHELTMKKRVRDINLCVGLGDKQSRATFYVQGGLSTMVAENAEVGCSIEQIQLVTLEQICQKYIPQKKNITFLKVDVEGAEEAVLRGGDFQTYRPWIIVMESTCPGTSIPSYGTWEHILLENQYHFAYFYGVNRYYVADERAELDRNFISMDEICKEYDIYTPAGDTLEEMRIKYEIYEDKILNCVIKRAMRDYDKFIICPFGNCGKKIKQFLNEKYGIQEVGILDNGIATSVPLVHEVRDLAKMDTVDAVVLLNALNRKVNAQLLNQIHEVDSRIAVVNVMDIVRSISEGNDVLEEAEV